MFCPRCGNNLPEGTRFCMNCGASVAGRTPQDVAPQSAMVQDTAPLDASMQDAPAYGQGMASPSGTQPMPPVYAPPEPAASAVAPASPYADPYASSYAGPYASPYAAPTAPAAGQQVPAAYAAAPVASAIRPHTAKGANRGVMVMSVVRALIAVAVIVAMALPWLDAKGVRDIARAVNDNQTVEDIVGATGIPTRSATDYQYPLYDFGEIEQTIRAVEKIANDVKGVLPDDGSDDGGRAKVVSISDPESANSYTQLFHLVFMAIAGVWGTAVALLALGILRTLVSKKSGLMRFAFLVALAVAAVWVVGIGYVDDAIVSAVGHYRDTFDAVGIGLPRTYLAVTDMPYVAGALAAVGVVATFVKRKA